MNRYFDHIFVISRCSNVDRRKHFDEQMKYLGVSNYSYWYVPDYDFKNSLIFNDNSKMILSHKRCTFGHYSCWKTCYELKYDNVLIIEDDAAFIKNKDEYNLILNDFETNFKIKSDIYLFDYAYTDYFTNDIDLFILASCYYVNRKALDFLISSHEKYYLCSDNYFYKEKNNDIDEINFTIDWGINKNIKISTQLIPKLNVASKHLCIQQDKAEKNIYLSEYNINLNDYML